jgi:NAD(P)H-hydrate epimerase
MATAGAGDVLTGIIVSLIGQGFNVFDASQLGVHIHGLAGDMASKKKGEVSMIASDILDCLPDAFMRYGKERL